MPASRNASRPGRRPLQRERVGGAGRSIRRCAAGQAMAEVREDALAEIGLGYPKLRSMLRELGRRFVAAGAIQQANDIFWLEKAEIDALIAEDQTPQQAGGGRRKLNTGERLKRETPPPMIPMRKRVMGIKMDTFVAQSAEAQAGMFSKACRPAAGKVTAPAMRAARTAGLRSDAPGRRAGGHPAPPRRPGRRSLPWPPRWSPTSAGRSATARIVAREYGIPAVMGTGVATRRIQK
jgi:rifampicin phosphotransferase